MNRLSHKQDFTHHIQFLNKIITIMKYSAILPLVPLAIAAHNDVVQQKNVLAADVASGAASVADAATSGARSEERRVGKECRL